MTEKPHARPRRKMTLLILGAVLLVGLAVGVGLFGMRPAWFTQNVVITGETAAYPELTPRVYRQPPERVFSVLAETAGAVPRWKVVSADPERRTVQVEVTTAMFGFVDDLRASVEAVGQDARMVISSRSQVGKGDLGENARHVAELQRRMDAALGTK